MSTKTISLGGLHGMIRAHFLTYAPKANVTFRKLLTKLCPGCDIHSQPHAGTEVSEWFSQSLFPPLWSESGGPEQPEWDPSWMDRLASFSSFLRWTSSFPLCHSYHLPSEEKKFICKNQSRCQLWCIENWIIFYGKI